MLNTRLRLRRPVGLTLEIPLEKPTAEVKQVEPTTPVVDNFSGLLTSDLQAFSGEVPTYKPQGENRDPKLFKSISLPGSFLELRKYLFLYTDSPFVPSIFDEEMDKNSDDDTASESETKEEGSSPKRQRLTRT